MVFAYTSARMGSLDLSTGSGSLQNSGCTYCMARFSTSGFAFLQARSHYTGYLGNKARLFGLVYIPFVGSLKLCGFHNTYGSLLRIGSLWTTGSLKADGLHILEGSLFLVWISV